VGGGENCDRRLLGRFGRDVVLQRVGIAIDFHRSLGHDRARKESGALPLSRCLRAQRDHHNNADSNGWAALTVATTSVVAYRSSEANNRRQFVWVDRIGTELEKVGEPDDSRAFSPQLSPSGRQVAVQRSINGNVDIWSFDLATHLWNRLTRDPSSDLNAQWSPDGTRMAFSRFVDGRFKRHMLDLRRGVEENLGIEGTPECWSSDGRVLLYHPRNPQGGGAASGLWAFATTDR
jgi:Tol biopolymer transport system component